MLKFATRLATYRAAHRLSQDEMGKKLGVTGKYVGMLERGDKEVEPDSTISRLLAVYEEQAAKSASVTPSDPDVEHLSPRAKMRAARAAKKLSFRDLAKLTRYDADVLRAIEEGRGQASERMIEAIAKALGLKKSDLMDGGDEPVARGTLEGTYGAKPEIETGVGVGRPRLVPLISMAQAGTMAETAFTDGGYQHEGALAFDPQDRRAFAVKIMGDSMVPNYTEGDVAIVYPSQPPRNGDCVLARLSDRAGGDVMFKLYSSRDGGSRVILSSYNPAYPPLDYPREDFFWIYPVAAVTRMLRK